MIERIELGQKNKKKNGEAWMWSKHLRLHNEY